MPSIHRTQLLRRAGPGGGAPLGRREAQAARTSIAGQSVQRTDRTGEASRPAPRSLGSRDRAKANLPPRPTKNAAEHAPNDLASHLAPD